ncbi:MAG: helix-turn-helix domain-containing protein [Mariniphaga sp.]|nr:helix-turn-helix domain-containing protein [Mariniphaga sp.]
MTQLVFVTSKDDLKETIREVLREERSEPSKVIDLSESKNRRQAAKFLGVSYQTMFNWTRDGIIKEHGQGRKKFYLQSELIAAMQKSDKDVS